MQRNKLELYLTIFIVAVIASTAFLYIQSQEKTTYWIFPEKLGDMSITSYSEGTPAILEVKSLHPDANIELENAYIADYSGPAGNKVKIWVSESTDNETAGSLLAAMNSMVGRTGMFSESTSSSIEGITVYHVTGPGGYHYFWGRDKRVFWVQINNPDEAYQSSIVEESIKWI